MKLLFAALVFLLGVYSIDAYRCYVCDSINDPGCGDPFDKKKITPLYTKAAQIYQACAKAMVGTIVVRAVANVTECPFVNGCGQMEEHGITGYGCCCNSEMCNGVSSIQQQILFPLVALTMCAILVYRWF